MLLHRLTHMLSCQDASRLLSQMQDRPLFVREWVKLRLHLAVCNACSRFAEQLRFLRRAMKAYRG